jgi:hypothetical protein
MAYSQIYTTVTGADTNETIDASVLTFPYLKKSHVEIRISGAGDSLITFKEALSADSIAALTLGTDYTLSDAGLITFIITGTLATSSVYQVQLKRNSDATARYVDFTDGSVVTEGNLDDAQKQQIYLTQELTDNTVPIGPDGSSTSGNKTNNPLWEHAHTYNSNYTIGSNNNAISAGPVTIGGSYSVTVPAESTWVIA